MSAYRVTRRDLRLASGLVLFFYVAVHLSDHALGLFSVKVAETGLRYAVLVWHSLPGSILLYGAAAIHIGLAFLALYERRTLRMPPMQALRIALGLWMPVLLIGHFVGTRFAFERYGLHADYMRVVWNLWTSDAQWRQLALLAPGWLHGCLGLNFAFGARPLYQRLRPVLFGIALLLPVLSALGFIAMGRELAELSANQAWLDAHMQPLNQTHGTMLEHFRENLLGGYFIAIGLTLAARQVRSWIEKQRHTTVEISYPRGVVQVPRGWTVLEASRSFGIAHLSMCGGRARCSTCRVRVIEGAAHCPPPGQDERRTLARIGAEADVRLACQLRPQGAIAVVPLLAPKDEPWLKLRRERADPIREADVAVLLIDLQRWTGTTHSQLSPHDTIHAINLYFEAVGDAITEAGGVQSRFAGESAMAIFGLDDGFEAACNQALRAATQIERSMLSLNARLVQELGFSADVSLCIHAGPAVVGNTGHRDARTLTAVGETISIAQRLRALTRAGSARFVISRAAIAGAGLPISAFSWHTIAYEKNGGAAFDVVAAASSNQFVSHMAKEPEPQTSCEVFR